MEGSGCLPRSQWCVWCWEGWREEPLERLARGSPGKKPGQRWARRREAGQTRARPSSKATHPSVLLHSALEIWTSFSLGGSRRAWSYQQPPVLLSASQAWDGLSCDSVHFHWKRPILEALFYKAQMSQILTPTMLGGGC